MRCFVHLLLFELNEKTQTAMAKPYSAFREFLWYIANITFVWMDPMVWRARFNKLRKEDLNLRYSEESESVNKWFQRNWETQLKLKTNSLFLALFRSFWFEFIIVGTLISTCNECNTCTLHCPSAA